MLNQNNVIVNNVASKAALEVHSREQVENLRSFLNKKGENIALTNLTIGKDGKVSRSVLMAPCNLETRYLQLDKTFVYTSDQTARYVDRFTKDIINIDLNDTSYTDLMGQTIYRTGEGFDEKFYMLSDQPGYVYNLLLQTLENADVIFTGDGKLKEGVLMYGGRRGGQNASASQVRKANITLACNNDLQGMIDRLNTVTFGAFNLGVGSLTTGSGLVKYAARLGQYKAPSCLQNFHVDCFAVYMGKFKDFAGNQYRDGSGLAKSSFVAKAFNTVDPAKFSFADRSVTGLVLQIRPWLTKIQVQVVESAYIEAFIDKQNWPIVYINRNAISREIQEEFNRACVGDENSRYYGKVVVISNGYTRKDAIDIFTDLNGLKTTFDLRTQSGLNLLDIGNTSSAVESGARTSTQMLQTLLYANPQRALEYLHTLGKTHLDQAKERLLNQEPSVPSISDFGETLYAGNIIPKFARKFVLENHTKLFRSCADNYMKGMSRDISMLAFDLPGMTAKIIPDFSVDFCSKVLSMTEEGFVEICCPAAEQYFSSLNIPEAQWIITGYKYPKMHFGEFLLGKVVSLKTICTRINACSDFSDTEKWLLRRQFKALSRSVIVVPAIELLKNMLAGMDFDADAMVLVFDTQFNQIILDSELRPLAVQITNVSRNEEVEQIPFEADAGWQAFERIVKHQGKSIGEITIMNDMFVSLLVQVRNNKLTDAIKVLELTFEGDHYLEDYESPLTIKNGEYGIPVEEINTELMYAVIERIKDMVLSKVNMEAALKDLVTIGRMLQELTIDSAKTSVFVDVPYDVNKVADLKSRTPLALAIHWAKTKTATTAEDDLLFGYEDVQEFQGMRFVIDVSNSGSKLITTRNGMQTKRYQVRNDFQELRIVLARHLWKIATELKKRTQEYTSEQKAMQQQVVIRADVQPLRKAVIAAKLMYDDMTGIMRSEIKGKSNEEKRLINAEYKRNIEALSNHVRRITQHLSPVDRAVLLTVVGGESNFAYTVCQEEFLFMVITKYADLDFAGERLTKCTFKPGERIHFVGGIANQDGGIAISRSNITGEYEISEHNGKLYASCKLSELVKIPAINELQLMFKTHYTMALQVNDIAASITAGDLVKLQAYKGDAITINGVRVGKFDCQDSGGPLSKLYNNAEGIVKFATIGESRGATGRKNKVLIVVLDHAKDFVVSDRELIEAKKEQLEIRRKQRENLASRRIGLVAGSNDY